jgi:transcriptional regulator GlxA family with amidase domain
MDERTLQRKTRALFGKSPKAVLTEFGWIGRLSLLQTTDWKVANVAAECGISPRPRTSVRNFHETLRGARLAPGKRQKAANNTENGSVFRHVVCRVLRRCLILKTIV